MIRLTVCLMITFGLLFSGALGSARPRQGRSDEALGKAQDAARQTRKVFAQARHRLEEDYRSLEERFAEISERGGHRFQNLVYERLSGLFGQIQEIYARLSREEPSNSRRALTRRIAPALRRVLQEDLDARPLTEAAFQEALVDALGDALVDRLRQGDTEPTLAVDQALAESIDPTRPFHEIWNRILYDRRPSAIAYAEAYNAYIAAGIELDRAQNPERYLPGGQRVPPGMVYVPGGSYLIGPNSGFEKDRRRVSLRPFLMDRDEVTNEDYRLFLEALPAGDRTDRLPLHWKLDEDDRPHYPEGLAARPVAGVTWLDANAYAVWTGKRLPTEEEWEVAASGKQRRLYPWGDEFLAGHCNSREARLAMTTPVGHLPNGISPYGCEDMAGNVAEWTASTDRGEHLVKLTSPLVSVVIRGGSFQRGADNVTTRFRWIAQGLRTRDDTIGFRCAADLE